MTLHKEEQKVTRLSITKTLSTLAVNCTKEVAHCTAQLKDPKTIHNIADGTVYFDLGELRRINTAMLSIPLHSLPDTLVSPTMIISVTVRQFLAKVEMTLRLHNQMDSAAFEDLFRVIGEMNESLKATCKDIEVEIRRIQEEI